MFFVTPHSVNIYKYSPRIYVKLMILIFSVSVIKVFKEMVLLALIWTNARKMQVCAKMVIVSTTLDRLIASVRWDLCTQMTKMSTCVSVSSKILFISSKFEINKNINFSLLVFLQFIVEKIEVYSTYFLP